MTAIANGWQVVSSTLLFWQRVKNEVWCSKKWLSLQQTLSDESLGLLHCITDLSLPPCSILNSNQISFTPETAPHSAVMDRAVWETAWLTTWPISLWMCINLYKVFETVGGHMLAKHRTSKWSGGIIAHDYATSYILIQHIDSMKRVTDFFRLVSNVLRQIESCFRVTNLWLDDIWNFSSSTKVTPVD